MTTSSPTPSTPDEIPASPPGGSLRLDVISGYVLAFSRVAAWAGVSAYVYREIGAMEFGLLALLRGTITLLSYTSLGLGPAMVHAMAQARRPVAAIALPSQSETPSDAPTTILNYAGALPNSAPSLTEEQRVFGSGIALARGLLALTLGFACVIAIASPHVFSVTGSMAESIRTVSACLALGVALRVSSEAASAALQARGRLSLDNALVAAAEICWLAMVIAFKPTHIEVVALGWAAMSLAVATLRSFVLHWVAEDLQQAPRRLDPTINRNLLKFGIAVVLAQTADFLYAPSDYIIIQSLLNADGVAAYAPVVQIDAALLLAVAGISAALFPRAAHAHAAGDRAQLRKLYIRGTLASLGLLLVAGGATLLMSEFIFRIWLGTPPRQTLEILPLVLIHTVIGGSSGVGRAVLLGMGKIRAFTASALIAGFANVALSAILAGPVGLGLKGIVIATIVVVVARCAIWMPWYVWTVTETERRRDGETK